VINLKDLTAQIKEQKKISVNSDLFNNSGIVDYYPEELVITVKGGTKTSEITKELDKNGQGLNFYLGKDRSIGALFASGDSNLSDSVLGVKILDGKGRILNFGGQVMKNVAGYDVSRFLVGSEGKFGIILEITFKVFPKKYISNQTKPNRQINQHPRIVGIIEDLRKVFDPYGIFS